MVLGYLRLLWNARAEIARRDTMIEELEERIEWLEGELYCDDPICEWCHRPFELKRRAPHARFCSTACRVSAHRKKHREMVAEEPEEMPEEPVTLSKSNA